jgi:hypothetical protein
MQPIQIFSLASKRCEPGLFCDGSEITLGGIPLLTRLKSGPTPRPVDELKKIFDAAYGVESGIDAHSRISGLAAIASALDKGDFSHASIMALMLRLPQIEPDGMERLCKLSAVKTFKYDDIQPRDWHGRWTNGNASSQTATVGPTTHTPARHLVGHGLGVQRQNPNIVPIQGAVPFPIFPPLFPGGPLNPQTPKKEDPEIIYPAPDVPQSGATPTANDNAGTDVQTANDNQPRSCPDPSFEPSSKGRTFEQLSYQSQIGGQPPGYAIFLNGVAYDGCRESDGTLLEAKLGTPWYIHLPEAEIRTLDEYEDIRGQAYRQSRSSGGRRVEWHFSDPQLSAYWRKEFASLGFRNISVEYTPYDEFYDPYIKKIGWQYLVLG